MSPGVRRRVVAPLAWLVLLLPPVAVWGITDVRAATAPPVPAERVLRLSADVAASYTGGLEVPFSYFNPLTDQDVDTVVPVFDAASRPAAGSTVGVIVDRDNPDRVVVPGDREPLWSTLAEYLWLPLVPVLVTVGRWHFAARVRRLIKDVGVSFAMLAALTPARRGTGAELHLYPVDAEPGALPLCTVPLLSTGGIAPSAGMLRVEVKGSPRPLGRVVARYGQSVFWPARRASNPRRVPRPRDLVERVSPSHRRAARDPDRPVAMLLDPAYLGLACVAALALLVLVAVQTGLGARTAATAYTQGDPVLAEVTATDPDGFTLGVNYTEGGGEAQRAIADVDWPEDYVVGRRYPAVVIPGQDSRVRLLSEPYDAVEPIIWGAIPAAAAGALLLRQHIYAPARRRRRPDPAHLPRGRRPRVLNTHRAIDSLVMFTSAAAAIGLTLLALVLLIGAVDAWNKTENILERGVLVTGEVSDVSSGRMRHVEVSYRALDGQAIVQDTVNFVGDYDIGDPIDVIYDPIHPRRMEAADWGTDHVTAYALGTLGSISGVLAVAALLNLAWERIRDRAARRHQRSGQAA